MSHNVALKLIPFNAFQYIPSLIRLEMTDCSIGTLEEGAFHKTPKIQVISLARNKLKRFNFLNNKTNFKRTFLEWEYQCLALYRMFKRLI